MQNYNQQQQAVILKGIAQQLLSMNVPSFIQLDRMLGEFGFTTISKERLAELQIKENKVNMEEVNLPLSDFSQESVLIDPPSGWKYGFPKLISKKEYLSFKDNQLNDWLVKNGYPIKEIEQYGNHFHVSINGDLD